jgi:hypothetical protein
VVGKAEILAKGPNPRLVVTNLPAAGFLGEPEERAWQPPHSTRSFTARAEKWKIGQRRKGSGLE